MLQLTVLRKHPHRTTRASSPSHSWLSLFPKLCRHCHHYRYLPRLTELIPLVLHHDVLQILPLHLCYLTFSSYPLSYPVAVHLRRRPLHLRHKSQHPSLTGVQPLGRAYCHERYALPQQCRPISPVALYFSRLANIKCHP
jgi:hypothetical protein